MAKQDTYTEFLKQDFQRLFDQMELNDIQRHFLGSRWLDQVLWMEKKPVTVKNSTTACA
ncbi:MAG: hypothetical protein HC812_04415 [Leptolyngbya sp. RL_3_1]|nr:hypothetical protein [Leptolyngbya sp. RL_3_1]